jgi:hypothetical protein
MMSGQDELREALQRLHDSDDASAIEQAQLDLDRQAFEQEEEATKKRLYEAAAAMLNALIQSGTAQDIPIGEKPYGLGRLIRSQKYVRGWEIDLPENGSKILCTDGRFVFVPRYPEGSPPEYTPLNDWIDDQIGGTRSEFRENGSRYIFAEAFRVTAPKLGYGSAESELRSRLISKADAITRAFADALHERKIQL